MSFCTACLAPPQRVLADKAYDADSLRTWLRDRGVEAVIPSNATRNRPYLLDKTAYKRRNLIERMFCRLKDGRRIATRYDRNARNFLSALALAATIRLSHQPRGPLQTPRHGSPPSGRCR